MKCFLFNGQFYQSLSTNLGLLLLRLGAGLTMTFAHGVNKLPPSEPFIKMIANLGFPLPVFFAWAAGISEFIGGIALACGLLTRIWGAFLSMTMFVAVVIYHAEDPFAKQELGFMYLIVSLTLCLTGPGKFSLDYLFSKKENV
jgi:putative oxidoreductase